MAHLLPPLISAVLYVGSALCLKRAAELGMGAWRTTVACNVVAGFVFAPLLFLGGNPVPWPHLWQPALVGLFFAAGQLCTMRSLQVGDVSIATPVLGLKIIFVAAFTAILVRSGLSTPIWLAALLSTAAIALLNITSARHHHVGATVFFAGTAAACYALFDVLIQKWSPSWGIGRFLPIMMSFVVLYSLPVLWLVPAQSTTAASGPAWRLAGAFLLALQSVIFVSAIAMWGQAAIANVLYSSRGLWSVLAVWLIGHWFRSREQHLPRNILIFRFIGATLLMAAIVIVIVNR